MPTILKSRERPEGYVTTPTVSRIMLGDAVSSLSSLPDDFFQTAVTSPPYWGLRDYGIEGQIGAEPDLREYIAALIATFRQVRRVLKPDATLWLNIGDSYTSGNRGYRAPDKKYRVREMTYRPRNPDGLKDKELIGVPWRLALALQEDGWYLRSDIIWEKPNCMPESVKDRPTRSHEYLFLFAKTEQYFYDPKATLEKNGRRKRTVWPIHTEPFAGAHFATFPTALVETCLLSTSRRGDWVLDPFFGSGTVGVVCEQRRRRYVGIELNPDYVKLARSRIHEIQGKFDFGHSQTAS